MRREWTKFCAGFTVSINRDGWHPLGTPSNDRSIRILPRIFVKEQEKIVVRSEDVFNHHLVPAERGHLTGKTGGRTRISLFSFTTVAIWKIKGKTRAAHQNISFWSAKSRTRYKPWKRHAINGKNGGVKIEFGLLIRSGIWNTHTMRYTWQNEK